MDGFDFIVRVGFGCQFIQPVGKFRPGMLNQVNDTSSIFLQNGSHVGLFPFEVFGDCGNVSRHKKLQFDFVDTTRGNERDSRWGVMARLWFESQMYSLSRV